MSEISVLGEKLKFDSFTGGCHTPLTHAAIDRTLTTILFSFPNETSSVLRWIYCKILPALGVRLSIHAGALPICYPRPHNYVQFYHSSKNIVFRTVNVLAFHKTLGLKDSCSNSDFFRDWARYGSPSTCNPSHVTEVSGWLVLKLFLRAFSLCRRFM